MSFADTQLTAPIAHDQSESFTHSIAPEIPLGGCNDDAALSSLLLLLKSTSHKSGVSNPIDAPLLSGGIEQVEDFHNPAYLHAAHAMARNSRVYVDFQTLRHCFHMPLAQAAKDLGTCTTSLKKICRKHNIKKWPCRQIRSLTNCLSSLQRACLNVNVAPNLRCQYRDEMRVVEKALVDITENPNMDLSHIIKTKKHHRMTYSGDGSESDSDQNDDVNAEDRVVSPALDGYIDGQDGHFSSPSVGSPQPPQNSDLLEETKAEAICALAGDGDVETADMGAGENVDDDGKIIKKSRRILKREDTSYSHQTGWIAGCSRCGKLGKYRSPTEGRPFQHSTGIGRYCGYFRLNPRRGLTQRSQPKSVLVNNPTLSVNPLGPTSEYMYMVANGLLPNLYSGHVAMPPQCPQLASVRYIGITGMGQVMPPMTVHDGMAEPQPEGAAPASSPGPNSTHHYGEKRPLHGAMGGGSNSGSEEGVDDYSLQQHANAVLGHVSPQKRQYQLYRAEMFPLLTTQPSQRYHSADITSSFSGTTMMRPMSAFGLPSMMPPRPPCPNEEPSQAALLTSALTALTGIPQTASPDDL